MATLLSLPRAAVSAIVAAVALLAALGPVASAAPQAPRWAPAATAKVHPGVQVVSPIGGCTANFVFFQETPSGVAVYLGQAAHCTSTGGSTATNGCTTPSLPLGTTVSIKGASRPGVMVYNSWLTMQQRKEEVDGPACRYNDFALVRLDDADVASVNPSVPVWGGPDAASEGSTRPGEDVFSYGRSSLRPGTILSPKKGISTGDDESGWRHYVYTVTPGIPGDSGSAFLDSEGGALGVVATLSASGSNGVGDLNRELSYVRMHAPGFARLKLALGTEPFEPGAVPLG